MIDVLIPLVLLLVLGYSIHRLVSRSGQGHHGKLKSELPVHRHPLSTRPGSSYGTGWSIEQSGLTWSLVTSGLNGIPSQIFDRRPERVKRAFKAFYELGSIFGVLGGVGAVGVTGWTLVQVWTAVWQEARSHAAEKNVGTVKILRRAIEHAVPSAASKLEGLQPLVSQLTWPGDWMNELRCLGPRNQSTVVACPDTPPGSLCQSIDTRTRSCLMRWSVSPNVTDRADGKGRHYTFKI